MEAYSGPKKDHQTSQKFHGKRNEMSILTPYVTLSLGPVQVLDGILNVQLSSRWESFHSNTGFGKLFTNPAGVETVCVFVLVSVLISIRVAVVDSVMICVSVLISVLVVVVKKTVLVSGWGQQSPTPTAKSPNITRRMTLKAIFIDS